LPKTVTRQRRHCDLNPGPSALESSTLTTRLPSHPVGGAIQNWLCCVTVSTDIYIQVTLALWLCVGQSTLSSQSQALATLTSKLSLRESNCERQNHDLQRTRERQQELTTSVRELARRAASPATATALPGTPQRSARAVPQEKPRLKSRRGHQVAWKPITFLLLFHPVLVYPHCSTPPISTIPSPTPLVISPLIPARRFVGSALGSPCCPAKTTTSRKMTTKYTWSPRSPKFEGTRPTGPIGRLCI